MPATGSASSSSSFSSSPLLRPNEHLAVLIPRHLWKPDTASNHCDNILCRKPFSLLERRHHCRKCGDLFCNSCSSRSTTLLDTQELSFLHPPRDTPISTFASDVSPVIDARVCDRCWDTIHGIRPPTVSDDSTSEDSSILHTPSSSASSSSIGNLVTATSTASSSSLHRRRIRTSSSLPSVISSAPPSLPPLTESLGELDAYPLRCASEVCKAQGGGRWCPEPERVLMGYAVPSISVCRDRGKRVVFDGKPPQRKKSKETVVTDGDFRYLPRAPINIVNTSHDEEDDTPEGRGIGGIPRSFHLSTF